MTCAECERFPSVLESLIGWRHAHGAPCWWLLREVYARHLRVTLPVGNVLEPRDEWTRMVDESLGVWEQVPSPRRYDGVLFRPPVTMNHLHDHIGIALGGDAVLHYPSELAGVSIMKLSRYHESGWTVGVYRYRGQS